MFRLLLRARLALVLVLPVLFLTACIIVPHPMTRHITGLNGEVRGNVDYRFIHAGTTKSDEVRTKLHAYDSGYVNDRVFWARWGDSHTGLTFAAGATGGAVGGTGRFWGMRNLLVHFDEKGTVSSIREFKDGELFRVLSAWADETNPAPLDVSSPVRRPVTPHEKRSFVVSSIVLAADGITFEDTGNPAQTFTVKPSDIQSLESESAHQNEQQPRSTAQTINFVNETLVGRKLAVEMYAADLMDLVIYLHDHRKR